MRAGYNPGVYTNWCDAQNQVHGYSGAQFKGFYSTQDAWNYVQGAYGGSMDTGYNDMSSDGDEELTLVRHCCTPCRCPQQLLLRP